MSNLARKLLSLEEPVLVVTHKNPDLDGASAVQAVLRTLRWHGKEVYTRVECDGELSKTISWMYDPDDFCRGPVDEPVEILEDAKSLVVLDCQPDPDRLGFDWGAKGPVVVVDHHIDQLPLNDPENGVYVEHVPSTGCVLMQGGILDPILYIGLWADTVAFRFRTLEAMSFAVKLQEVGLTDDLVQQYHQNISEKYPPEFIEELKRTTIYRHVFENGHVLLIAKCPGVGGSARRILSILCRTGNTVAMAYTMTGKASLRTDGVDDINVQSIAKKYEGGGHIQASGCKISNGYMPTAKFHDFRQAVLESISKQLDSSQVIEDWIV